MIDELKDKLFSYVLFRFLFDFTFDYEDVFFFFVYIYIYTYIWDNKIFNNHLKIIYFFI